MIDVSTTMCHTAVIVSQCVYICTSALASMDLFFSVCCMCTCMRTSASVRVCVYVYYVYVYLCISASVCVCVLYTCT